MQQLFKDSRVISYFTLVFMRHCFQIPVMEYRSEVFKALRFTSRLNALRHRYHDCDLLLKFIYYIHVASVILVTCYFLEILI